LYEPHSNPLRSNDVITELVAVANLADASRIAPMAATEEVKASFVAVISSAILQSESLRADVEAESLMVPSFILKLPKNEKRISVRRSFACDG